MSGGDDLRRYARQIALTQWDEDAQRQLGAAGVTLIGCGALGSALAETLVRAGVGRLRLVDRDFVELDNLQRQTLFDEDDVAGVAPKAVAAAAKLSRINSTVRVEPVVADASPANIAEFCADADLILDGTDNLETRYLINDLAISTQTPWIYGAVVATEGRVMPVVPGRTACLRCIFPDPPAPGELPTCETAGVLAPAVQLVAAWEATEALKLLAGRSADVQTRMIVLDAWTARVRLVDVGGPRPDCPCCGGRDFAFLSAERTAMTTTLCGRQAVQITPPTGTTVDLHKLAESHRARVAASNPHLLRLTAEPYEITIFSDGRAIIKGTEDPAAARAAYARYVGA